MLKVKIINSGIYEGIHELTRDGDRIAWAYLYHTIEKRDFLTLKIKQRRDYLDIPGLCQFGFPFLEEDLDNLE